MSRLAAVLRFAPDAIASWDLDGVVPGLSFRAKAKLSQAYRAQAIAAGQIAARIAAVVDRALVLPQVDLPDVSDLGPTEAAEVLRVEWGFGDDPVGNSIALAEAHGVRIFSLPAALEAVDAFCFWSAGIPFILLNPSRSTERMRFDVFHELGHLVLHQNGTATGDVKEAEANQFASVFLMPAEPVTADFASPPSLDRVLVDKMEWGVSAVALVHRYRDLGLIEDWQYRDLFIEASRRGLRTREWPTLERELSQVLKMALDPSVGALSTGGIAAQVGLPAADVWAFFEGLVVAAAPVGAQGRAAPVVSAPAALRLVR